MTVSKEIPLNSFVSVICYSLLIYVKIERKIKHRQRISGCGLYPGDILNLPWGYLLSVELLPGSEEKTFAALWLWSLHMSVYIFGNVSVEWIVQILPAHQRTDVHNLIFVLLLFLLSCRIVWPWREGLQLPFPWATTPERGWQWPSWHWKISTALCSPSTKSVRWGTA